ncbi:hypothetical protein CYY_004264 [Polysphondylium violaceum]|uniref:Transcription factor Iwr1 domain-containing protein n=1 Tax=Polysphondylium violaceum TaxID=133409 RepID=A0A8J4V5F2_9MYCE|nr:hypothetical protein CYY_004264 [Polysphondylium violaceum]
MIKIKNKKKIKKVQSEKEGLRKVLKQRNIERKNWGESDHSEDSEDSEDLRSEYENHNIQVDSFKAYKLWAQDRDCLIYDKVLVNPSEHFAANVVHRKELENFKVDPLKYTYDQQHQERMNNIPNLNSATIDQDCLEMGYTEPLEEEVHICKHRIELLNQKMAKLTPYPGSELTQISLPKPSKIESDYESSEVDSEFDFDFNEDDDYYRLAYPEVTSGEEDNHHGPPSEDDDDDDDDGDEYFDDDDDEYFDDDDDEEDSDEARERIMEFLFQLSGRSRASRRR